MGIAVQDRRLEIHTTENDRREAVKLLQGVPDDSRLIAIGIGAASAGRRWLPSRYAEVCRQLTQHRLWPVIVCSSDERNEAAEIHRLLNERASIVSGAPLREVCAVLGGSELFIGNDSGCAHLAAAMGCKTIVVSRHPAGGDPDHFNSPARFRPLGAHVQVLQPTPAAEGCRSACTVPGPHCILNVTVDAVVEAAVRFVNSSTVSPRQWTEPERVPSLPALSRAQVSRALRDVAAISGADVDRPSL